jgi:NAD(P)-dependent dehydrogenase (short-subunit alcohol dehydrogenase family)
MDILRKLFDLSGRVALITGGSRGLGLQIAEALGESINTIASRHRYALQALRRILKPAEHERI